MANSKKNYWRRQLDGVCALFGFSIEQKYSSDGLYFANRIRLRHGRSSVSYKTRTGRELKVMSSKNIDAAVDPETACKDVMGTLSGKELVTRGTEKPRKTPWGFTRVRTERHIMLPEFSSCEELKLKLEMIGI